MVSDAVGFPYVVVPENVLFIIVIICSNQLAFVSSFQIINLFLRLDPKLSTTSSVVCKPVTFSNPFAGMFLLALYPTSLASLSTDSFFCAVSIKFSLAFRSILYDKL